MLKTIPTPGDTSWFTHDRFGLFIHFGTYALAARHEWMKQLEQVEDEPYMKYFRHFDPDLYDPDQWADIVADLNAPFPGESTSFSTERFGMLRLEPGSFTHIIATDRPALNQYFFIRAGGFSKIRSHSSSKR